jgi:hypothetical protein
MLPAAAAANPPMRDRVIARGAPLLLLDTCAVGDILREAHRLQHRLRSIEAARALSTETRNGTLTIVAAQTVLDEWVKHRDDLTLELQRGIQTVDDGIARVIHASSRAGAPSPCACASHTHANVANNVVDVADELIGPALPLDRNDASRLRAMDRAIAPRRPARKGQTAHDCEIIEHCLGLCQELRGAGFAQVCVFVTSNINDYCDEAGKLHPDLVGDFAGVDLRFVTDLSWARNELGL